MNNKPKFYNGQKVQFTIDGSWNETFEGKIEGKSFENVIDLWIVDFSDSNLFETYPFQSLVLQHNFIQPV